MFVSGLQTEILETVYCLGGGGTPILGHISYVRPEWMSSPSRKLADGCKVLTKKKPADGS